ncbi:prolipoprotein diacylglyceryl transferase [Paenibacillus sp. GCM10023252]|uniref:prolipoprotein diacylglyceryl transferase n=1 Tax=Paenibacillus sp. GCM10023252 TaxID=3252649 RepID=UPI003620989C
MSFTFPVYLHLGKLALHPHFVFESLAYMIGFRLYLYKRMKGSMTAAQGGWVIVGAILGAAAGSKLLYWLEDPLLTLNSIAEADLVYLMSGKTIVGGLLGGLIGVELAKKRVGVSRSTGDDMAIPLAIGMAIGRIGCFLTGLSDHTYGTATSSPLGVDFGDGIMRHPTQLYEIAFLAFLGLGLWRLKGAGARGKLLLPDGAIFQLFMTGYLTFRFAVDFIKPTPHPYLGLNNVQLACLAGLAYYVLLIIKQRKQVSVAAHREEAVHGSE